ncbi:MAG: YraN family protein [Planctomycetota bacterium]
MFKRRKSACSDAASAAPDPRHELGRAGESLAADWLKARGLKLVTRHFNTPVGELDLVMRDGATVVFVEVKTRRDRVYADPQDAVNATKQRRSLRAARWFMHEKRWDDRPCRFDVVTVILPPSGQPQIAHFPDAFLPD